MAVTHDILERLELSNGVTILIYPQAIRLVAPSQKARLTSCYETHERGETEMSHTIQWD